MQMLIESLPLPKTDLQSIRERIAMLETEMQSKHPIYETSSRLVITGQLLELRRLEGMMMDGTNELTRTG